MPDRLLWLVNTRKGAMVLRSVLAQAKDSIGLVSTYSDKNVSEDYAAEIEKLCGDGGVPFETWSSLKKAFRERIDEEQISGIVTIGWQYLVPKDIWADLPNKLIVFHDSLLPRYRGFAPVATGMIKGETEFGASVLHAGDGIDDGDIIFQQPIRLEGDVYISEAIERIGELYSQLAVSLTKKLASGALKGTPQNEEEATYSIWRGADDGLIDWRSSARKIYNLIRAVGRPYPGAFSVVDGRRYYIWRSEMVPQDVRFEIRDCGKIWALEDGMPVVVCGSGLLRLCEITDEQGVNVLPFKRLRLRFG